MSDASIGRWRRRMRPRLLVVDDNDDVRELFEYFLGETYDTVTVRNGTDAIKHLTSSSFDLLICDCLLPDGHGRGVAEFAEEHGVPAILITGDPKSMELIRDLPFVQLTKPFLLDELGRLVERVLVTRAA